MAASEPTRARHGCSDAEVAELVRDLDSLADGPRAAELLAACGERAVAPLRTFLMQGRPSGVFQPRQRAVETLAALGAKDVLMEYLTGEMAIPDPVDAYGEEAVVNTAARLLARWRDDKVYRVLLALLRRKATPGAIDAVGEFRRVEAIPVFIAALGDSISRTFAEEALRKAGAIALPALLEAALRPWPSAREETPTSRIRRRGVLRLLAELGPPPGAWEQFAPLLRSSDLEIAARASRLWLDSKDEGLRRAAVRRLASLFPKASCFLQFEMADWLRARP
ncbi:hypothetical protein SAMN04488503_3118 [Humidesulfovibrio mexicanus]|uniref:HEAT repeat-containing protein n=1 Tax=Humidesulfovibrio mexicanus TaxID=147047 RepID=A0A239CGS2_9BACT|nr:hypothetical protein [Humidesulfovibrio mexicanus]SNS19300.1 hypothetical protein SAMN04488503_3118 [Humidesulfovibrio mexicanus]